MNFKQFAWGILPILLFGCFATAQAQTDNKNYPFTWKETTDDWFKTKTYKYKYQDDLTAKGSPAVSKTKPSRGPVCTNECKETTAPDACTESLLKDKLKDVQLPGFKLPQGYSGVEYVTFEVQHNGRVNGFQVVKQPVQCKPCIQKAVNLVASSGEWHPAIQDGLFVKSTVVVPVYFK
jgi:hypothetical protein